MNLKTGITLGLMVVIGLAILSGPKKDTPDFAIAIHGGAGTITRKNMTSEKEAAYRSKPEEALNTGYRILKNGGSSLNAVEATFRIMED